MPTAAEKARKDALEVQKKRTDEAIARRTAALQQGSTQSSKVAATRPKLIAASAKRKQIQTAAFQSPLKRHKPMSTSKLVPTAECVRCHVRNETPRIKCIFCNASVHPACTTPIARAVGLLGFPDDAAYCSLQCYTDDTGNSVPTPAPTVERNAPVAAAPTPLPAAPLAPTPTVHRRTKPGDFVEGDAITSAILKHSGVKAPRPLEIPPRSLPSRRPPSPERKTLQFESTSPIQRPERASSSVPTTRTVEPEQEQVRYVNATAKDTSPSVEEDVRYHDYFNPPRFLPRTRSQPSLASPSAASWSKRTIAAGVGIVLIGMVAAYVAVFMESIPFCDSNASTTGPTAHGFCHPCPDYGICFSGDLQSCKEPYLRVERACLEPSTVSRDADLMTQLLPRFLVKRATSALCNATLLSALLANESSKTAQVVTNAFDLRNYLLHQAMWDKVDAAVFDMTFHKAMRQLKEAHPEFYYTTDGDVVLNRDDVEVWCAVQLHLHDNREIYVGLLVVLLTSWAIFAWQRRRRATASQIKRLVHAVHVALKQPSNDLVDGAVSHLRHTLWGGKADRTWQRVVQAIHDDARIRERYIVHRGQQVLIWEWIGTRRDDRNILRGQPVELVE